MKKNLLAIAFLFAGYTAHSQILISLIFGDKLNSEKIEFGLDGGFNMSTINGLDDAEFKPALNIGFYFDFKFQNPALSVNTGLMLKSSMGAKGLPVYSLGNPVLDEAFTGGSVTRQISYFNLPVMMKYTLKNHIYAKAGIMAGLKHNCYDTFLNTFNDEDDLNYKNKIRKMYHPLDAGLVFGAGYRLLKGKGINIGIQYYFGLVDVCVDDSNPDQYNRAIYLNAGIPIGK